MTSTPENKAAERKNLINRIAAAKKQTDSAKKIAKLAKATLKEAKRKFKDAKRTAKKLRKSTKALEAELQSYSIKKSGKKSSLQKHPIKQLETLAETPINPPLSVIAPPTSPDPIT